MNPKPAKGPEDRIIHEFGKKLQMIYEDRTAGDYTFVGVLGDFLHAVDYARNPTYPARRIKVNDVVEYEGERYTVRDAFHHASVTRVRLSTGRTDRGFFVDLSNNENIIIRYREGGMSDDAPTEQASRQENSGEEEPVEAGGDTEQRQAPDEEKE